MLLLSACLRVVVALLPVFAFLVTLLLLDSFKLVKTRWVIALIAAGSLIALACLAVNRALADATHLEAVQMTRYLAPLVEELLKGTVVAWLIARHRVAFLVDAAITGFAVGTGFAVLENLHYLIELGDASVALWIVRGFGTAVMHGSVTAIMAILSRQLVDARGRVGPLVFLPGLASAVVLHSLFNHFLLTPAVTTALILVVLPTFFVMVFRFSERRTRDWLGTGFDTDAELLEAINAGRASGSHIGHYLQELRATFPPTTVADMLCLLRLRLELSIRAKGILIARQAGFSVPTDPDMEGRFAELGFLEHSIGPTGVLAMAPLFHFSNRDLWQYHMIARG